MILLLLCALRMFSHHLLCFISYTSSFSAGAGIYVYNMNHIHAYFTTIFCFDIIILMLEPEMWASTR